MHFILAIIITLADEVFAKKSAKPQTVNFNSSQTFPYNHTVLFVSLAHILNSLPNSTSTTGPFVDNLDRLDLTRASISDTGMYKCTGVDAIGGRGSQVFTVEIVVDGK